MERQIQLPGPAGARVAAAVQVTRARVHKYVRLLAQRARTTWLRIIICMPTSCCDKRTTGARRHCRTLAVRRADSDANRHVLQKEGRDVAGLSVVLDRFSRSRVQ